MKLYFILSTKYISFFRLKKKLLTLLFHVKELKKCKLKYLNNVMIKNSLLFHYSISKILPARFLHWKTIIKLLYITTLIL